MNFCSNAVEIVGINDARKGHVLLHEVVGTIPELGDVGGNIFDRPAIRCNPPKDRNRTAYKEVAFPLRRCLGALPFGDISIAALKADDLAAVIAYKAGSTFDRNNRAVVAQKP